MSEGVRRAVDAGRLAVPHRESAVEARAGKRARELRTPRGRRAEFLVETRDGEHVVLLAHLALALELAVEAAEGGALVAGHERARLQSAARIGAVLVERDPDESLDPGQEDPAVFELVAVLQRDLAADVRARGKPAPRAYALAGHLTYGQASFTPLKPLGKSPSWVYGKW